MLRRLKCPRRGLPEPLERPERAQPDGALTTTNRPARLPWAMTHKGVGPQFGDVDAATVTAAAFITYLDAAREIGIIAQGKQWTFEQLRLESGWTALDVGCGTGEDVVAMAAMVAPTGRAVGLDASEAMVTEAIQRHGDVGGASFQQGDAQRLPFDSDTFDACRCERTLLHVDDPTRAVGEIARVLKPGGRVALIEPDLEGLLIAGSDPHLSRAIWEPRIEAFRQPRVGRRLRGLLTENGFVDITLEAAVGLQTDLATVDRNFGLERAASDAAEAGVVSERDARRWLDELRQADHKGLFLCSTLSFRTAGRKPDK